MNQLKSMKIKVYTIPKCPYCTKLKELLDQKEIKYEIVDVSLDEHEEEFKKLMEISGCESVPMVTVGVHLLAPDVNFSTIEQAANLVEFIINN